MASILRTLGVAGATNKKKKQSPAPRIVNAGFEETTVVDNDDPAATTNNNLASISTEFPTGSCSSTSHEGIEEFLRQEHQTLAEGAADSLVVECTSHDGWAVWDQKENLTVSKKTKEDGTVIGRAEVVFTPPMVGDEPLYNFDFLEKYLWDDKTKGQYDEFTERILVLMEYKDAHFHVVNQVFKGRFGICGREFVLLVAKERRDTETHDHLVICAVSIPPTHVNDIETLMAADKLETFKELSKKVVRGTCNLAGYVVSRDVQTNEYRLVYMNDADVKSRGVPQWIVTRVKLDQLKIAKAIPGCVEQAALNGPAEEESEDDETMKADLLESLETAAEHTAKTVE